MSAQPEQWRVSTVEGIFEADLETLKQWIVEGAVLPTDKVSKGTLNWIDAGRVPKLKRAFDGELDPPAPPPIEASPAGAGRQTPAVENQSHAEPLPTNTDNVVRTGALANACYNHPGVAPKYVCRMCATTLCGECPKLVGTSKIAICPLCGDLCRSYAEVTSKTARAEFQESGFGISDFLRAVGYPFQHKVALIAGALMYGFLLLAGFRGSLIAWMLMFGCISHVISQVAWGRFDRSFMPDFSAFSLWDDVVQPIFLGVGITIVSWGPVIALVIVFLFGVVKSGVVKPGLPNVAIGATQPQSISPEQLGVLTGPNADPNKFAEDAERPKAEQRDPTAMMRQLTPFLGTGILLALLLLIGLVWGLFYYPMALTVAGYTQSFWSVVNPLVGLDTIRRMRSTYFKAFGMVILIQLVSLIIGGIVAYILSPLAMPLVGNLPANFIYGAITFYFNLVIACLLGLSLYKCADRLGINVD